MSQDLMSYDSICKLIGRIVLENNHQVEQLGQSIAQLQQHINNLKEEKMQLTAELQRKTNHDVDRSRENNA